MRVAIARRKRLCAAAIVRILIARLAQEPRDHARIRRLQSDCGERDRIARVVHKPQRQAADDDLGVEACRRIAGADRLVGLSTHTPAQVDGAAAAGADYIGVGPVHATPTKPGRSAVGLALVEHAAGEARLPWFAIGGIGLDEIGSVVDAGAQRVAVVRALTDAEDPQIAAGLLRSVLVEAAAETADV